MSKARGFLMLDALLAITIATALIISFTTALATFHRGERKLAEERATMRRLEDSMLALQRGGKVDSDLVVERLPGGVAGRAWVRLSTPAGAGPRHELVGLVPAGNAPPGGAP